MFTLTDEFIQEYVATLIQHNSCESSDGVSFLCYHTSPRKNSITVKIAATLKTRLKQNNENYD